MNIQSLIARVRAILLKPRETWPEIAAEPASVSAIYRDYVLILAAVPALGMLIGTALFGIQVPMMGTIRIGFGALLTQAVLSYAVSLLMTYAMAVVIESLAPTFGAARDRLQGLKTVASHVELLGNFNSLESPSEVHDINHIVFTRWQF